MPKKWGLVSSWPSLQNHLYPTNAPPSCPPQQRGRSCTIRQTKQSYTQAHGAQKPDFCDNMNWPTSSSKSTNLTPYSILDLDRGAKYSKQRFFELVKIYHPDRQGVEQTPCSKEISHSERLERYRLVILAHEILSDPVKRRAYDDRGAGWTDFHHSLNRHSQGNYAEGTRKPYGRGPGCDDSPFSNATWEDWERWYARSRNEKKDQSYAGNFIDPNMFASLIIVTAVISGVAQTTNIGENSGSVEERAQAFTAKTSRFLENRAEVQKANALNSSDRIKWFLNKRDPSKYGLSDNEQHVYEEHFSPRRYSTPKESDSSDTGD